MKRRISALVDPHTRRSPESLANLTATDIYHGRGPNILKTKEQIKKTTIRTRRSQHQAAAA